VSRRGGRAAATPPVRWLLVPLAFLAVLGAPTLPAAAAPSGPSPWAEGLSGSISLAHDPDIAEEDGTWYVVSTEPGLRIRSSRDLVRWEDEGLIFPDGWPDWLEARFPGPDRNIWAPDLERIGELWYLTYSRAVFGTQDAAIGVATSPTLDPDDPTYRWTDHGMVVSSDAGSGGVTAIDPNLVVDEAGAVWLAWGSFWGGIALTPFDPATYRLVPGVEPTILAKRTPWFHGIEGAHLMRRDGWWWLSTSWGYCCSALRSHYAVRIGRSRDLAGPYVDLAGRPLLEGGGTLLVGSHGDRHGPGHGSLFVHGDRWSLVHHYYDRAAGGRETLGFTPLADLDGWPLGIDPDLAVAAAPGSIVAGTWRVTMVRENVDPPDLVAPPTMELGLRADGSVVGGGRWRVDGEVVRVDATRVPTSDGRTTSLRLDLLVDEGGGRAMGRDDRTAVVRLERTGAAPAPEPVDPTTSTTAPPAGTTPAAPAPPAPPATPVAAVARYAG
jgi:arabinan endo-1,5-alpha-L-arabinosidase